MKALVSIITPCYNSEEFIDTTIKSVLSQTYENWELIIVDDRSTDKSIEIINAYQQNEPRIQLVQLPNNSGAAICRNTAIELAKGTYIAFLDSDDIWTANKLSTQIEFMYLNEYSLTFGAYKKIDEQGVLLEKNEVHVKSKLSYQDMLTSNKMGCLTVVYNAEKLGKVFMPLIRKRQDYALWLKILSMTPYAYGITEFIGFYRVRATSISSSKVEMLKWNWKLFREIEKKSMLLSLYYVSMNVFHKLFK